VLGSASTAIVIEINSIVVEIQDPFSPTPQCGRTARPALIEVNIRFPDPPEGTRDPGEDDPVSFPCHFRGTKLGQMGNPGHPGGADGGGQGPGTGLKSRHVFDMEGGADGRA
jgi:hypothetical protein